MFQCWENTAKLSAGIMFKMGQGATQQTCHNSFVIKKPVWCLKQSTPETFEDC